MVNLSSREDAETLALSVKEACELISLGRTSFYKFVRLGNIPAYKCGGRTIVLRDELEQALKTLPRVGRAS
jgi:excisionase family DNA binding protein